MKKDAYETLAIKTSSGLKTHEKIAPDVPSMAFSTVFAMLLITITGSSGRLSS